MYKLRNRHYFGGAIASLCGLARPDMFCRVVLMGYPFLGAPELPFNKSAGLDEEKGPSLDIHQQLANLSEPRKNYKWYYSTTAANAEMSSLKGLKIF